MNNVMETVRDDVLREFLPGEEPSTLTAETPLISGGIIDSFSLMDLALFVEDTFGVRIDDTELNADTFDTLNTLADLIIERQDN